MPDATRKSLVRSASDHFRAGRFSEAAEDYQRAITAGANSVEIYDNLGIVFSKLGRWDEAIAAFTAALRLRPSDPHAGINLGNALAACRRFSQAIDAYENVLALYPNSADAHYNAGRVHYEMGRLDDAIAAYRRAIELNPLHAEAHGSLGNALKDSGKIDEALSEYRRAIEAKPTLVAAYSNFLYSMYFSPETDIQTILREHRRFNDQFAAPLAKSPTSIPVGSTSRTTPPAAGITVRDADPGKPPMPSKSVGRRLRIGYVSPDFRTHCNSHFTLPLLASHDRGGFEIYCYSDVKNPDEATEKLRSHADAWRSIVGLCDEQAADIIANDNIDILVDLTLHMAHGRPLLFARKPAPVQVTWLGCPGTTGLSAMDYRLTDPYLDPFDVAHGGPPAANADCYVEKTIWLPETYWCYDPMNTDLAVSPLPASSSGQFTFGCLNNFCKVNDRVLEMFAGVLRAVDDSRLLMLAPAGETRQRVLAKFRGMSIADDRIEFVDRRPWREYMELYHRIDMALDTFPWNGHTTSLDGLWMGAPVVTLCGASAVSRGGLSMLSNLGLHDLVGYAPEQYIDIAMRWASDRARLSRVRLSLRERMQRSPLMDKTRFARNVEAAYSEMSRISGLK